MRKSHVIGIAIISLLAVGSVAQAQTAAPSAPQARQQKGGRLEKEAPLFAAKVMLVCPSCGRPTRVGYDFKEGTEKLSRRKFRVCKHPDCGKPVDL